MEKKSGDKSKTKEVLGYALVSLGLVSVYGLCETTIYFNDLIQALVKSNQTEIDVFGPKLIASLICLIPTIPATALTGAMYFKNKKEINRWKVDMRIAGRVFPG